MDQRCFLVAQPSMTLEHHIASPDFRFNRRSTILWVAAGAIIFVTVGSGALFLSVLKRREKSQNGAQDMTVYDFHAKSIDGSDVSLSEYKGRVLLIVNVASQCGFTPQYEGLESLYKKYKDEGLTILGFPSNQFGAQEPGPDLEIKNFCESKFGVTFPLFSKIDVNGANAHPLYTHLKEAQPGILGTTAIKWNFTKFLVNRQGGVIQRYAPQDTPKAIEKDVEAALKART